MTGTDRGVSEVLGYVLIFALVTGTIAIVFTIGVGGLQDTQQAEQVNNVERAFDVFGHNLEHMHERQAPSRATEIRLIDGTLTYGSSVNVTLEIDNEEEYSASVYPRPLEYHSDGGTEISYEAGAIFRSDGDSNVMLSEPKFDIREDRTVLPVVRTMRTSGSVEQARGDQIVLVVGSHRGTIVNPSLVDGASESREPVPVENDVVTLTISTERADAWGRYFEAQEHVTVVEVTDDEVVVTIDTDEIVLIRTRINLELIP